MQRLREKREREADIANIEEDDLSKEEENMFQSFLSGSGTAGSAANESTAKRQKTLPRSFVVSIPDPAKDIFLDKFYRWVIVRSSTLSFNVVEDKLLKEAFQTLGLPPPDRKKISGTFLQQEFDRVVGCRAETLA